MNTGVQAAPHRSATERYEALLRLSQALISNCCSEEVLKILVRELREVVEFHYLGVGIYDEKLHEVRLKCFDHAGAPVQAPKLSPEETLTWRVYQDQEPWVIPVLDEETRFPAAVELLKREGVRSVCVLPLTTVRRRLGGLAVGSEQSNPYSGEEVSFLSLVANQVALAIDAALSFETSERAQRELQRKHAELQVERDRLQLLLEVTNQVVSNLELRDLLRAISANIREVMHCDAAGISLPGAEPGTFRLYALDFPQGKGAVKEELLVSSGPNDPGKRAFETLQPVIASVAQAHEFGTGYEIAVAEGIKTICFIPLASRGRALGTLAIARVAEGSFTQEEVEFLSRAAGQISIAIENALAYREISELKDKLAQEKLYLEDEIRSELNFEEIVGQSAALRRTLGQVETVAPTESTVLINGETGTGKELIARAIHDQSPRRSQAFVKLNCAAIPTGLLESELFGHEKGAFTGAIAQRIGRFELANGGTIFLDEIGEIPLELQPKLLRVLQEREFERLGSSRTLRTDARLIAATNRDLGSMVEEARFRADLFYRLNVFPVHVPSLRERSEDIPLLVRHFAQEFSRRMNKHVETIPSETLQTLVRYPWPGNIRELQNVIERAVILSTGPMLRVPLSELKHSTLNGQAIAGSQDTLEEAERKHILKALEDTSWVLGGPQGAAARLGMKRSTLQYRLAKLGISRPPQSAPKAFSA
jgi:formate hydrogenlyase transcriptional activator